ncbi:hypothetical protein JVT61DRAFT_190 [Boletus reticuloceps]|uniref:choline-phosphate cytidylyltransferase n=1 Tax=Boletus reticuloceps TaxID=495285 RepID=A0A8I3ADQ2_9AGAM|nr:hypothetical protein JVT61DRAFT_190 [Boletus reticuloceps]
MDSSSSVLSDEDYDVISNPGQRSLESSIADFGHIAAQVVREIPPTDAARQALSTASLSSTDIQTWVRGVIDAANVNGRNGGGSYPPDHRTVRVYVDGVFDVLTAGYVRPLRHHSLPVDIHTRPHRVCRHMLQLRQAKLAFPSVHLMAGVFSDEDCQEHGTQPGFPHVERCELLRHCRWVDEIVPDVVWTLTDAFLIAKRIDYVVLEEGSSVNPEFDKTRLKGYDHLKKLGMFSAVSCCGGAHVFLYVTGRVIPTKRTLGLAPALVVPPKLPSPEATPLRKAPELQPEVFEGDGQVDVTHGINKMTLDGQ